MIPYGQEKKKKHNYTDCHPKKLGKDVKNWWEVELGSVDKGRERQESKRAMAEEFRTYFLGEMVKPKCDVVNRKGEHCPNDPVHFIEDENRRFKLCEPCYINYINDAYRIREYLMPPTINPDQLQILAKPKE